VAHPRLMVLTCTGVSFFHGSNDGQKGMGLIMLILIGTVPTAYALNHAVTATIFRTSSPPPSRPATSSTGTWTRPASLGPDARAEVTDYIRTKQFSRTPFWRFENWSRT
jgi:inorganic phosphate transporter, PiT family